MVKVHIIGGSGSGKTTLAETIASNFHVPHYDLDILGQRNGTDDDAWMSDIERIVQQTGWVTEGIYLLLIERFLYDADYVVVIDIPWRRAAWQIIRRHITQSIRGTNRYPGLKALLDLLRYARLYYLNQHNDAASTIRQYLTSQPPTLDPPTKEKMLTNLATYPALIIPPTAAFVRQYLAPYNEKLVVIRTTSDRKYLLQKLYSLKK